MVIAWSKREDEGKFAALSAWQRVEETQTHVQLPCLLVPQPAHAVLAGELAEALLQESFGELPPEIKQAILMHDTGWAMIDAAQIQRLRSDSPQKTLSTPVAFPCNSPQETVEAWTASIDSVEPLSAAGGLGALIVSRHFTLLAKPELGEHKRFIAAERTRQHALEAKGLGTASDLQRWTAALGFCDLVSLYLLTGLRSQTEFRLAHPASPPAESAARIKLTFDKNRIHFDPPAFETDCEVEIEGLKHPVSAKGQRTEKLSWEIV
jgi:Protein of unknown function (DUF3891)